MRRIVKWGCGFAVLALIASGSFALGYDRGSAVPAGQTATVVSQADPDALEAFRTERQQLRQMQLSQLNEIIHGDDSETEIIALAQQRQLELMDWSEKELTLEGLLAMRGFEDAVATVHTDSVNVMVRAETVSKQEAAVILELVTRETGISGGNVKIIPIN